MARRFGIAFTEGMRRRLETSTGRVPLRTLILTFVLIATGFMGSTLYAEWHASAIDHESAQMQHNALPSIEHLTAARTAIRHVETAADAFTEQDATRRGDNRIAAERAHRELDHELLQYSALPFFEGEREMFGTLTAPLDDLDAGLEQIYARTSAGDEAGARRAAHEDVRSAVDRADTQIRALIVLNAAHAGAAVERIAQIRGRSMATALGMDLLCLFLAVAAGLVALRAVRRWSELEREHAELLATRADELEQFASRVAHDLLSPLTALSFSMDLIRRHAGGDGAMVDATTRARACLKRAQRLVDGIYDFARSGARIEGETRADVREAIDGVLDEVRAVETQAAELTVIPFEPTAVACTPGVLISILSNLVRNAVKYTREAETPRITVRVQRVGLFVRIEVEDNGPGLPAGLHQKVFEPYVRAPGVVQPGLGLGLATVRRLVEAHGGSVGVRSSEGKGCLFWFELPNGDAAERASPRRAASGVTPLSLGGKSASSK